MIARRTSINLAYSLTKSLRSEICVSNSLVHFRLISEKASRVPDEARKRHQDLQKDWIAPLVHYDTVKKWSQSPSTNSYLIDVREPDETIQGIIPSAVTLPLSGIATSLHMHRDDFIKQHGYPKPGYDQEIVFYCRSGKRSQTACDVARRNGYTNVKSYDGSWLDWVKQEQVSGAKS